MKTNFGKTYGSNQTPTHGVYTQNNLTTWGNRAVAISHHWSRADADAEAAKETAARNEPCVVVEYEEAA